MQTLPKDYFLRGHNKEYYVQEQIYKKLRFLNELPMVQNETGEFTNYVIDNDVDTMGDPITIAEGVEFNEISFGKPSSKRGATIAKGFMFKWTDKMARQGRLNANMQIFLTKAVAKMVSFYDKNFLEGYSAAAGATAPASLTDWSDSTDIDCIADEIYICDAMEAGGDSGFKATTMYLSRADALARQLYMKSFEGKIESELNYVSMGSALPTGTAIVVDTETPVATIEKYADPNYSVVRQAEMAAEKAGTLDNLNVPESFINIWEPEPRVPGVHEVYIWAEANVNVTEPKGIMVVDLSGN